MGSSNLEIEYIKNGNINDRYFGKKVLHLNTTKKGRLTLKFQPDSEILMLCRRSN